MRSNVKPLQSAAELTRIVTGNGQGNGGEFFTALRQLADENEAMLVFDEVQTGVGLTGRRSISRSSVKRSWWRTRRVWASTCSRS